MDGGLESGIIHGGAEVRAKKQKCEQRKRTV